MRPMIGVFTSERHAGMLGTLQREGAPEPELRLGTPYLRAVEAAGGLPVVLAPEDTETAMALLDRIDGLCLAGGPDLDPLSYGDPERHELLGPTSRPTDVVELSLPPAAHARGMPLLGICPGAPAPCVSPRGLLRPPAPHHP